MQERASNVVESAGRPSQAIADELTAHSGAIIETANKGEEAVDLQQDREQSIPAGGQQGVLEGHRHATNAVNT